MNKLEQEIINTFEELSKNHSIYNCFEDFLKLSAIAIRNSVDTINFQEREDEFLNIKKKYSDEEYQKLAEILGRLTILLMEAPNDYLGNIFMKLNLGNKWLGQCFTPYNVAKMCSALVFSEDYVKSAIKEKGYILINEPCIGAGAMAIAAYENLQLYNIDPSKQLLIEGGDMDIKSVYMSYIQLSLLGASAIISHKDALTLENWGNWKTPSCYINFG